MGPLWRMVVRGLACEAACLHIAEWYPCVKPGGPT